MDCRNSSDFPADFTAPGYKPLPGVHECERSILGLCLREPDNAPSVISALPGPHVFDVPQHRRIFEAIRDTCAEGKKPDLPTVGNRLFAAKADDSDTIITYASDLMDEGFLSLAGQHCATIKEDYARRRLHTEAWIAGEKLKRGESVSEVLSRLSSQSAKIYLSLESDAYPVLTIPEILDRSECISWAIEGIVPANGVTILSGDSGVGKTWLAVDLGIAYALGRKWLGRFSTTPGPVLFIDEESGTELLAERLRCLAQDSFKQQIPLLTVVWQRVELDTPEGKDRLKTTIRKYSAKLVVVDSLVRVHSRDENSAGEMKIVMTALADIARNEDCAFLVTHHTRKKTQYANQASQMLRGTTEIKAAADAHLYAEKIREGQIRVIHEKSRFRPGIPPFVVTIESDGCRVRLTAEDEQRTKVQRAEHSIVEYLTSAGEPLLRRDLEAACKDEGTSKRTFSDALGSLRNKGIVDSDWAPVATDNGGEKPLMRVFLKAGDGGANGNGPQAETSGRGQTPKPAPEASG